MRMPFPASVIYDLDRKKWVVATGDGWKELDELDARFFTSKSVVKLTAGLGPEDQTTPIIVVKIGKGYPKDGAKFESVARFEHAGELTFEWVCSTEDDPDGKFARFQLAFGSPGGEVTVAAGVVCWGDKTPDIVDDKLVFSESKTVAGRCDGSPVMVGSVEGPPSSCLFSRPIALKPGFCLGEYRVKADHLVVEGACPPFWPEGEEVVIRPFIGAITELLDSPLRPDIRG